MVRSAGWLGMIVVLATTACSTSDQDATDPSLGHDAQPSGAIVVGVDAGMTDANRIADAGGADLAGGFVLTGLTEAQLCRSYEESYAARATTAVVGGAASGCTPGELTPAALEDFQRRVNWYRQFYAIPSVPAPQPAYNAQAQECALMMAAEGDLSHDPAPQWECYTQPGAEAAGQSNLSLGDTAHAEAIDGFVFDFGNNDTLGHRRWVLFPGQRGLGYGFFPGAACQVVLDDERSIDRSLRAVPVPYPPPGAFPAALMSFATRRGDVVKAAWSISWGRADFSEATVRMADAATGRPIALSPDGQPRQLADDFGDSTAIFEPEPVPRIGDSWQVVIEGIRSDRALSDRLVYTVDFVDCGVEALF